MRLSQIRYLSFDCYGTLTNFKVGQVTRACFEDRVAAEDMPRFLEDFTAYRFDEVLGAWKPYREVLRDALARCCRRWGVAMREADASVLVEAIPTWGPHEDVPGPLAKVAARFPLVILSNASNDQIQANVDLLGAPFHAVLTAEDAQIYKPRFQAFEFMFDSLDAGPEHFLHVSSSLRYDLMSAHDLRIAERVFVDRGHGPGNSAYGYHEVSNLGGLPAVLGI